MELNYDGRINTLTGGNMFRIVARTFDFYDADKYSTSVFTSVARLLMGSIITLSLNVG